MAITVLCGCASHKDPKNITILDDRPLPEPWELLHMKMWWQIGHPDGVHACVMPARQKFTRIDGYRP
jgi:hypothetical protein